MDIKAGPSSLIHSPSTMARGATRKAVLALEVRSRELHGQSGMHRERVGCSAAALATEAE